MSIKWIALLATAAFADEDRHKDYYDDILSNEEFKFDDDFDYLKEFDDTLNLADQANVDFDDFDANKDGELDAAEIRARFHGYLNEQDMYHFYAEADSDHSGTTNREEYIRYVRVTQKEEATDQNVNV